MFNKNSQPVEDDKPQKVSFFKKRGFQYGSMATVFTALFVVVVVLVNIAVSWMSSRYPLSIDMTTKQTYKLDAKSITYVKTLTPKITINVLDTKDEFLSYADVGPVVKILEQYPQYNHNITINYIDYNKNPNFQNSYPNETLAKADVIVSCGTRYKHLTLNDLVSTETDSSTYQQKVTGYTAEQAIDTALMYVSAATSDLPIIDMTTGHSEADSTTLQGVLKKSNYQIETKNLSSESINTKAKAIAIVDPSADFTSAEIKKIDDFLTNGGAYGKNLIVFMDPQHTSHTNLDAYLSEWGIGVQSGAIYDQTNSVNNDPFEVLNGTTDSGTLGSLKSNAYIDLAVCRPLSLLFATKGEYTTTSVVQTKETAKLTTSSDFTPQGSDKSGPFTVMAKSVKAGVYNNTSVSSTVLVSGTTSTFNVSQLVSTSSFLNSDVLTNAMNKVVGGPKLNININTKTKDDTALNITAAQQNVLEILFIFIIPICVLAIGLIVWLRRRHL